MPRVLGYTPPWLSRPSDGYDVFASAQKTPSPAASNGAKAQTNGHQDGEGYRGPHRTIAYRGTEVFVVVDNQIRWSDLSMLKENWEALQRNGVKPTEADQSTAPAYKVLKAHISQPIRQLSVSPNGQLLAIATSHTAHVAILPNSSKFDEQSGASIKLQLHTLGPTTHVLKESPISSILWHPCGVLGSCLVTVTIEGGVRLWELNKCNRSSFDNPTLAIDLKKLGSARSQKDNVSPYRMGSNRGFSANMIDMEIASACFGGTGSREESAWSSMTLWTVTTEGDIYALCPLLPGKWQPNPTLIASLTAIANTRRISLSQESHLYAEDDSVLQDEQWTWLSEIDAQEPFLPIAENDFTTHDAIYDRPDNPGPIPRLQGPFQLLAQSSAEDSLEVSDIHVIASGIDEEELLDVEDDDSEQDVLHNTDGLSSAVVCLLTIDGRVHLLLDLEGVEGQWLPAIAPNAAGPEPETRELLTLEVLQTLGADAIVEEEWPTFSRDPFSRYAFFATHSQGVFYFSLEPWVNNLEDEMQSATTNGAQIRLGTIRESASTLRERILRFDLRGQSPAANACIVLHDNDIGYFLLTSTNDDTHPHAVTLDLPRLEIIKTEPFSDDPKDPSADPHNGEAFTEIVTRPAYKAPAVFWQDPTLHSAIANTVAPHRRRMMQEGIRFSHATLNLMTASHRLISEITPPLHIAAADLISRCQYMMQDMAEQLNQVRVAAARAQSLQQGGGDDTVEGNNANERLESRLERARRRDVILKERMGKLKRQITKLEAKPLNDRERDLAAELRHLDEATDSRAAEGIADGNGPSNGETGRWRERFEEVSRLSKDLVGEAKGFEGNKDEYQKGGDMEEYSVPSEMKRKKVEHVMGLLERESALVDAVTGRLERLGVGMTV
ncbi:MAG: hypothetical protein LQ344_004808 [Seirophora lacunosa]|nr:MAG: hypothetical protein LQ344_004808 [Seirophora lacunosa]